MRRESGIRNPLLQGTQPIAGLWLDAARLPEPVRRQRLLQLWREGAQAFRFREGDAIRYASGDVRHIDCASACGEALRATGSMLCSAPLSVEERRQATGADLVLVRDAHMVCLRFQDASLLDPATWIDLDDTPLHEFYDCSDPPALVRLDALGGKSARQVFGEHVPPASGERDVLLHSLLRREGPGAAGRASDGGLLARMLMGLAGMIGGDASATTGRHAGGTGTGLPARRTPARPSALRDALSRMAIASRLSMLIGARHSAHFRRLLKHFDNGDIMEALRHAIPIDGLGPSLGQAFSLSGRRDSFDFSGAPTGSLTIGLPSDLRDLLSRRYRDAFERLDREGRIDEAAFVLAELLNARQECLDYLERHGRATQAAELALTWEMPPGIAIRLLLVAGDIRRATLLARRDNAFSDLVPKLERTDPGLAIKLRIAWGEALADCGEWLTAVNAVWPVPQARQLALGWLQVAEQGGEALSARALVQRAALLPDTLLQHGERIVALSHPDTSASVRTAIGQALLDANALCDALSEIAIRVLPALVADRAEGCNDFDRSQLDKLAKIARDPALRTDMPQWALPSVEKPGLQWSAPVNITHSAPAAGLHAIYDACLLPQQRYLLALGESGAIMIDRSGKTLRRYSAPCHQLVISDNGHVALALAGREAIFRVTRLDLVRHIEIDLGSISLQDYSRTFDGIAWSVVANNRLLVLDTARSLSDALWHVDGLPGPVVASRWLAEHALHLIRMPTEPMYELWCYRLPERRLIRRAGFLADPEQPCLLMPPGELMQAACYRDADTLTVDYGHASNSDHHSAHAVASRRKRFQIAFPEKSSIAGIDVRITTLGIYASLSGLDADGTLGVYRLADGACLQRVCWPAGSASRMREYSSGLLVFDDSGRLLDLSPKRATPIAISLL